MRSRTFFVSMGLTSFQATDLDQNTRKNQVLAAIVRFPAQTCMPRHDLHSPPRGDIDKKRLVESLGEVDSQKGSSLCGEGDFS